MRPETNIFTQRWLRGWLSGKMFGKRSGSKMHHHRHCNSHLKLLNGLTRNFSGNGQNLHVSQNVGEIMHFATRRK